MLFDDGKVLALLPMQETRKGKKRTLTSLTNYYSPHFDIICYGTDHLEKLTKLIDLGRAFFSTYDVIAIAPLTPQATENFLKAMCKNGFYQHQYKYSTNWRQEGISGFAEYWSNVSSRLQTTVKRKSKKLAQLGGYRFSIAPTDDLESALLDYHEVYYKSWKVTEPTPSFIDTFSACENKRKNLKIFLMHHNDLPVAAQLWFVADGKAYIYKLAYDPDYSTLSVGTLLSHFAFHEIIESEKAHTIDYLTGDDGYKADWLTNRSDIYGIKFSNLRTMRGLQAAARDFGSDFIKKLHLRRTP